jgi:hypothetical protein
LTDTIIIGLLIAVNIAAKKLVILKMSFQRTALYLQTLSNPALVAKPTSISFSIHLVNHARILSLLAARSARKNLNVGIHVKGLATMETAACA